MEFAARTAIRCVSFLIFLGDQTGESRTVGRCGMSFVIAMPEVVATAATDLAGIRSTISAAHAAAAPCTTVVLAAGADEVSSGIAAVFGEHAQAFQSISAQATAFHDQFVKALSSGAGAYAAAEAANVS